MGRLIAALMLLLAAPLAAFPSTWDASFRRWTDSYMPGVDWRLLKAQCWQESRLTVDAVSPAGAKGLCQFMDGTWREANKALKWSPAASQLNPELSIQAAAWYMGKRRADWRSPRPEWDRHSLALASYNAGLGHILKAQRLCGGALLYTEIMACLPQVTGKHARETQGYAPAIWRHYQRMVIQ